MTDNKNIFLYKIVKRVYLIICWEPVRTMHYTVLIVDPDLAVNRLNWVTSQ